MTLTLITPWLAAIVGILSTGFAIAYPSLDQYSQQYPYRIPHYELKDLENQGSPLQDISTNDLIIREKIPEKWPGLRAAPDHGIPHNSRPEDSYTDNASSIFSNLKKNSSPDKALISYIDKVRNDWPRKNSGKIRNNNDIFIGEKSDFTHVNKKSHLGFESNPQKRSSTSLENDTFIIEKEGEAQTVPVMSLQELLKYWGIDTSEEKPTVRTQRGDIEITDLIPPSSKGSLHRGDVPAYLLHSDSLMASQRKKRDVTNVSRKLLWSSPKEGVGETNGVKATDGAIESESHNESQRRKRDIIRNRNFERVVGGQSGKAEENSPAISEYEKYRQEERDRATRRRVEMELRALDKYEGTHRYDDWKNKEEKRNETQQRRKKRELNVHRKLRQAPQEDGMWGFGENDGMKTSGESNESDNYYEFQRATGSDDTGYSEMERKILEERERKEAEMRRKWEEERQRRNEERRRIIENQQRGIDEDQPRRDEQQRNNEETVTIENVRLLVDDQQERFDGEERRIEEERRRNYERQRRIEEEQRRNDEEQQRRDDEQQRNNEETVTIQNERLSVDDQQERIDEEERRIEEEQRRNDERQRRIEEEQRRNDEERRRIEDEQRRNDEEQQRIEDEERRNDEQQRRIEDEQRRIDEEQQINENEQRTPDEGQRAMDEQQERLRRIEEQRRNYEQQQRRNNVERQRDDRERRENVSNNESSRRNDNTQAPTNENDTYEARLEEWKRMKEAHDRLVEEKKKNRNHGNNAERNRNRNQSNNTEIPERQYEEKSPEQIENERKLQEYIRRNTPITVGNRGSYNPWQPPINFTTPTPRRHEDPDNPPIEGRPENLPESDRYPNEHDRRMEERRRNDQQRRLHEEEMRRREEEYRRRQEEEQNLPERQDENERSQNRDQERWPNNRNEYLPNRETENDEIRNAENERRLHEEQRRLAEEQRRQEEEQKIQEEEQKRLEEEQKRLEEEQKRQEVEEQRRLAEEQRRLAEEQIRLAEEQLRQAEELKRQEEEERRRQAEEQRRQAEEQRRLAEEEKRQEEEQRRLDEEEERRGEEQRRLAEEQRRQAEEQRRLVEEQNKKSPEQNRRGNQEFQGIKGHNRNRNPAENQRSANPNFYKELDRLNNQQNGPNYNNNQPINELEMQQKPNHNFREPTSSRNEASVRENEGTRNKYVRPNDRYRQPQENDQGNPEYPITKNDAEEINRPEGSEQLGDVIPVDIENRRIWLERRREEEERRRDKPNNTRERLQDKSDQRSRPGIKGRHPLVKHPLLNQESQLQEQKRQEEGTTERYLEFKGNSNNIPQYKTEEQRKAEEERLRKLPVSATITITNSSNSDDNKSNTRPDIIGSRFADKEDLSESGPRQPGVPVPFFEQNAPMRRRPVESPKACVWSIVICCSQTQAKDPDHLRKCFEATNCPEANWDPERCSVSKIRTSNSQIMRFYLMGQQSSPSRPSAVGF